MKQEGRLKTAFRGELERQLPTFLILGLADAGGPDRLIVGNGVTSFWEFKHATPDFASPGNQVLFCARLDVQSYCRYVIWQERDGLKRTMIVQPRVVLERNGWNVGPESFCVGFDHRWLVGQIRKVHKV